MKSHNHPNPNEPPTTTTTLLGGLRTAVGKVRLLLRNPTATSWRVISLLRSSTTLLRSRPQPRHLSFNDRRPSGLIEAFDDVAESLHRSNGSPEPGSTPSRVLNRMTSCTESLGLDLNEDGDREDVDTKADMFIANFYRQLRLEKQVSLELRYCRGYSFGSSVDRSNSDRSLA